MDVKELDVLGDSIGSHWYYRAKSDFLRQMLRRHRVEPSAVLDVGAGSGFFCKEILGRTGAISGVCVDPAYALESTDRINGKTIDFRRSIGLIESFDLALFIDVLEHVEDDAGLLASYRDYVLPEGYFLISVPAFSWLWSDHDDFLEHKRRYTAAELRACVHRAGLRPIEVGYIFGAVLPMAALSRLPEKIARRKGRAAQSQLRKHGRLTNDLLLGACSLELRLAKFNRIAGLSVVCLATTE